MADRYWVGGSANWDGTAGTKWALTSGGAGGQAVPTAADDVYIDSGSGAVKVTVTASAVCRNLSFVSGAGAFVGEFAGTSALAISGNLTLSSGMTRSYTGAITFNSTTNQTITSNGKALDSAVTFNGVNGVWQLADNFVTGSSRTTTLTNGTLNLNSKTLTTGLFSSVNSNIRTIAFGSSGKFIITGNSAFIFNTNNATNLSVTGSAVVDCTYSGATGTRTISSNYTSTGGTEANAFSFNITAGTDSVSTAISSFKSMDFTGFSGTLVVSSRVVYGDLIFSSGMTIQGGSNFTTFSGSGLQKITTNGQVIDFQFNFNGTGTCEFQDALTQGSTREFRLSSGTLKLKSGVTTTTGIFTAFSANIKYLQSTTPGVQATLSQASGTVNAISTVIQDINAVGGATWNAYVDNGNIDAGNVDGWDFGVSPVIGGAEYTYALRSFTEPRRF